VVNEALFGVLFETFFANWLNARFFFRSTQKDEVDFILYDRKNVLPVEVKIRERLSKNENSATFTAADWRAAPG
jgi:predicted AAA+ superfamily ATPase